MSKLMSSGSFKMLPINNLFTDLQFNVCINRIWH